MIVCYGRTPTICGDYLIAANKFKRIAYYHSDFLEPSVGYLPEQIENGSLGLPAEIYMLDSVVLMQIRTSVRFARKKSFIKELNQFLEGKFKHVIFLCSLPYTIRPDVEIESKENNIYFYSKSEVKH